MAANGYDAGTLSGQIRNPQIAGTMNPSPGETLHRLRPGVPGARAPARVVTLLALAAGLVGCGSENGDSGEPPGDPGTCTITHLSDGDSVICAEGNQRVRLLLIDAPELAQRPWGDSAQAALAALIPEGRTVRLEYDVQRRDDYGRLLAYLWLEDGRLVNEEIARAGYVVLLVYPPNVRHQERIRAAVEEARDAGRALWATPAFDCLPVDFRAGRCGAG